ncbi:MAG TPA: hypothetical protein VHI93_04395, partial [Candidatus Thermoplasmatota archaeon]|nr:hypothetical protein [Candidatus Thermoplasmatota archaeon]
MRKARSAGGDPGQRLLVELEGGHHVGGQARDGGLQRGGQRGLDGRDVGQLLHGKGVAARGAEGREGSLKRGERLDGGQRRRREPRPRLSDRAAQQPLEAGRGRKLLRRRDGVVLAGQGKGDARPGAFRDGVGQAVQKRLRG